MSTLSGCTSSEKELYQTTWRSQTQEGIFINLLAQLTESYQVINHSHSGEEPFCWAQAACTWALAKTERGTSSSFRCMKELCYHFFIISPSTTTTTTMHTLSFEAGRRRWSKAWQRSGQNCFCLLNTRLSRKWERNPLYPGGNVSVVDYLNRPLDRSG